MEQLILSFNRFAEIEAKNRSPLYYFWCKKIIQDPEMLQLLTHIPKSQPKPNLFFATIQFLLMKHEDALKKYMPSFVVSPLPVEDSYFALQQFVKKHEQELLYCFQTKRVQTNEVRRSAYLYPIFSDIAKRAEKPLALIEIGTSAGLLLNIDKYRYEVKQGDHYIHFGNLKSKVIIKSENLGNTLASCSDFQVSYRYGIDLNVLHLQNQEDYMWLDALIWPEHAERRILLQQAAAIHTEVPKTLVEGDMLKLIPSIIQEISIEHQIVIFHTHVANQFSAQLKESFQQTLINMAKNTPIYHVYNNMYDENIHIEFITAHLKEEIRLLPKAGGHGEFFYWR
ncbi:DUF2332 domain-containing protein [Bacillus ndiopicus]|uniref:DUF2332 domain-containing protein n=1 Tax=Bacillus ndiopicus TaxID=1347368 RepID=UPI0005A7926D|nr:DUF2332 domain-containing protein [Bacillus ndiopicus]